MYSTAILCWRDLGIFLLMIVLIITQNDGFHYDIQYLRIVIFCSFMFTSCLHSLVPSPFGPFAPLKYSPFALTSHTYTFFYFAYERIHEMFVFLATPLLPYFLLPLPLHSFLYPLSTTPLSCQIYDTYVFTHIVMRLQI